MTFDEHIWANNDLPQRPRPACVAWNYDDFNTASATMLSRYVPATATARCLSLQRGRGTVCHHRPTAPFHYTDIPARQQCKTAHAQSWVERLVEQQPMRAIEISSTVNNTHVASICAAVMHSYASFHFQVWGAFSSGIFWISDKFLTPNACKSRI